MSAFQMFFDIWIQLHYLRLATESR